LYLAAFVFVDRLRLRHRQPQHPGRGVAAGSGSAGLAPGAHPEGCTQKH